MFSTIILKQESQKICDITPRQWDILIYMYIHHYYTTATANYYIHNVYCTNITDSLLHFGKRCKFSFFPQFCYSHSPFCHSHNFFLLSVDFHSISASTNNAHKHIELRSIFFVSAWNAVKLRWKLNQ